MRRFIKANFNKMTMTIVTDIILWTIIGVLGLSYVLEAVFYLVEESKYKRAVTISFFISIIASCIVGLIIAIIWIL